MSAIAVATPHSLSFSLRLPLSLPRSRSRSFPQTGYLRASARRLVSTRVGNSSVVAGEEASTSSSLQAPSSFNMTERTGSVKQQLASLVKSSLQATFPDLSDVEPQVAVSAKFGDYQCNNAMGLWSKIKGSGTDFKNPISVGEALAKNLPQSEIIESTSVARPGFVNINLSNNWISKRIKDMLVDGIQTWAPILSVKKAVVDFSSPNIAKEMHVGHLRSTIIGDTLARMFEFSDVEVLRRNHVGDWGTQFGMLIEYLYEQFPNWEDVGNQAIGDLQEFYKASKKRFDDDASFKERAQQAVVKLQGGEAKYRAAWQKICEISRSEFDLVYKRLNVSLEERGESFYNPYIPDTIKELTDKGLVEESDGARVIFLEGFNIPLIIVKSDGGYNYASTDLTALRYRLQVEQAEWIIYVTDVGQQQHFDMFFSAARKAGWLPPAKEKKFPRVSHVGFGLVLGSDGKRFRTRSSEVVRLVELLDEAKTRSKAELIQRLENNGTIGDWTDEELDKTAEAVGYGAVKYADLKNNRLTNYTFSFDQMLKNQLILRKFESAAPVVLAGVICCAFRRGGEVCCGECWDLNYSIDGFALPSQLEQQMSTHIVGNTAVYLEYAHARICSIVKKSNKDISTLQQTGTITLDHPDERVLALHLIQFAEVVEEACNNLLPNVLCEYLYNLSEIFNQFYTNCRVIESPEETSRLLLCQATAIVMRQCFVLLGIAPVFKL